MKIRSQEFFYRFLMILLFSCCFWLRGAESVLWKEDGSDLIKGSSGWQENEKSLLIRPAASGKGFTLESPEHDRHTISIPVPIVKTHPWMIWKVVRFNPEIRYKGLIMPMIAGLKNTSLAQAGAVEPGIWQTNLGAANELPPQAAKRNMRIDFYGGSVDFEYIKIVEKPDVIIEADSASPAVGLGDEVVFRVTLSKPAEDVTLRFFHNYCISEVKINNSNTLQLLPVDRDNPLVWQAKIRIDSATPGRLGKDKQFTVGTLFFKATILGGGIDLPVWTANIKDFNILKWE